MIIQSLELENFRNYGTLSVHFDSRTNILYGDNAQGKIKYLRGGLSVCHDQIPQGAAKIRI